MAIRFKYDAAGFGGSITGGGSPSDKKYGQQLVLQQQQIAQDAQRLAYGQQNQAVQNLQNNQRQAVQNQFQLDRDAQEGKLALGRLNQSLEFGAVRDDKQNAARAQEAEQTRMRQAQEQARMLAQGDIMDGIKNGEFLPDTATQLKNNMIAEAKVRAGDKYDELSGPEALAKLKAQKDALLQGRMKRPAPPTIDEELKSRTGTAEDGSKWMKNKNGDFVPVKGVLPPPAFAGEAFKQDPKTEERYRARAEARLEGGTAEITDDLINETMVNFWNSDQKLHTLGMPVEPPPGTPIAQPASIGGVVSSPAMASPATAAPSGTVVQQPPGQAATQPAPTVPQEESLVDKATRWRAEDRGIPIALPAEYGGTAAPTATTTPNPNEIVAPPSGAAVVPLAPLAVASPDPNAIPTNPQQQPIAQPNQIVAPPSAATTAPPVAGAAPVDPVKMLNDLNKLPPEQQAAFLRKLKGPEQADQQKQLIALAKSGNRQAADMISKLASTVTKHDQVVDFSERLKSEPSDVKEATLGQMTTMRATGELDDYAYTAAMLKGAGKTAKEHWESGMKRPKYSEPGVSKNAQDMAMNSTMNQMGHDLGMLDERPYVSFFQSTPKFDDVVKQVMDINKSNKKDAEEYVYKMLIAKNYSDRLQKELYDDGLTKSRGEAAKKKKRDNFKTPTY